MVFEKEFRVSAASFGDESVIEERVRLSWRQRLALWWRHRVFIGNRRKPIWDSPLPFYLAKCGSCRNFFINYPQHQDKFLPCVVCREAGKAKK
jgi:hypothetical protein